MPRIFDNIQTELLPALRETLGISSHADFCVGYFNLRGWKTIADQIDTWDGSAEKQCRLLVGMQRPPQEDLREAYTLLPQDDQMSNNSVIRLKRKLANEFRNQLTIGAPTNSDEVGLRKLSEQLKTGKGDYVDTSLLEASIIHTYWASAISFATEKFSVPMGSAHHLAAPYQALQTKDGWVTIGCSTQALWLRLLDVLKDDALLKDPRFIDNASRMAHLADLIENLSTKSRIVSIW